MRPAIGEESTGQKQAAAISDDEAGTAFLRCADKGLLVAISGGPDSTALLGLLAACRFRLNLNLFAATVDHGLRSESGSEAEGVARFAKSLGVPHAILPWTGEKPQTGLQASARAARFRLLTQQARHFGAEAVVTGHSRDDQAETVLMRLLDGSGVTGLAAMRESSRLQSIDIFRPFLGFPKARLIATCEAHGWPFVTDPSNRLDRFTRVRIRKVMQLLEPEGLNTAMLATLARRAAQMDDALESAATELETKARLPAGELDAAILFAAPIELSQRVIARAIRACTPKNVWDEPHRHPLRLERLETLTLALRQACQTGTVLRRSLGAALVQLTRKGMLTVLAEPPRRRGRSSPEETI